MKLVPEKSLSLLEVRLITFSKKSFHKKLYQITTLVRSYIFVIVILHLKQGLPCDTIKYTHKGQTIQSVHTLALTAGCSFT